MIVGKIDSNPTCDQYLGSIAKSLPSDVRYSYISFEPFILDTTIKENILFG